MTEPSIKDPSHHEKTKNNRPIVVTTSSTTVSQPSVEISQEKRKSPVSTFLSFSSSSSKAASHNRTVSTGSTGSTSMFSRFTLSSQSLFSSAPETLIIKRVKEYIITIDKCIKMRENRISNELKFLEKIDDANLQNSKEAKSLTMHKIIERQKLNMKKKIHGMYIKILQIKKKEIQQLFYFIEQGSNNQPIAEADQKRRIRDFFNLGGEKGRNNNHEKTINDFLKPLGEKEDSLNNNILNEEAPTEEIRKEIEMSIIAYKACNKLLKEMRGESSNRPHLSNSPYVESTMTSIIPDGVMDGESHTNHNIDAKSTENKEDKKERFRDTLKELIKMYHLTETDKKLPYETRQKILRKFLDKFDNLLYEDVALYKKWIDEMKSIRDRKNAEKEYLTHVEDKCKKNLDHDRKPEPVQSEENIKQQTQYIEDKIQPTDKLSNKENIIGLDPFKTYHSNDCIYGLTKYFYSYIGFEFIVDSINMNDDNSVEDFDDVSRGETKLTEFLGKSLQRDEDLEVTAEGDRLMLEEEEEELEHRQPLAIFTRMMKNVIFSSLHEYFFGYLDDDLKMTRRNQEWREMLAEVRKISAADIGVATEYLPLVDFVSNVKKQVEEEDQSKEDKIKSNKKKSIEEPNLAKQKSLSDISMTVFHGDSSNSIYSDEREAYQRGLAKIGDDQSTEIMNLLEKDAYNENGSTNDDEIESLEGIKNAYYKTSAVFSRLSMAMNTDEMTRIITEAMKQLHLDAAEVSGQNNPKRKSKPLDADTMFPIVLYCIIHADLPDMPSVLHVLFTFLLGQDGQCNGEVAYYSVTINAAVQQIFPLLHGYKQKLKENETEKNVDSEDQKIVPDDPHEAVTSEVNEDIKIEPGMTPTNNSVTEERYRLTLNNGSTETTEFSDLNNNITTTNDGENFENNDEIVGNEFEINDNEKYKKDSTEDSSDCRSSIESQCTSDDSYNNSRQMEHLEAIKEYGYLPMKDYGNESNAEKEEREKQYSEGWRHLHSWLNKHEDIIRGLAVLQEEGFIMD